METLATWFDYVAEDHRELVTELLDDESPFLQLPEERIWVSQPVGPAEEQTLDQHLISTLHSGPTIQDMESALSMTCHNDLSQSLSQARMSVFERGTSKIENNKYTLKLRSCGNGMLDDGYKWRKYGQKSIKNSPYPRSYYRCTNSCCNAKKQVERSGEDHDTLIITYEGLHFHFAYPSDLLSDQHEDGNPPIKKLKRTEPQVHETQQPGTKLAQIGPAQASITSLPNRLDDDYLATTGRQGLLEDVVPFMIRNPSHHNASSYSSSHSSNQYSPSTSSSCPSWSPDNSSSYLDLGINNTLQ